MANTETKKTVLVVDDEEIIRELVRRWLEEAGYNVILIDNGKEAISVAKEQKPDIVVLDIRMPGKDGIDTMYDMHTELSVGCPPIILHSAYTHYKENFMSWSNDAYVVKTGDPCELLYVIKSLLERKRC